MLAWEKFKYLHPKIQLKLWTTLKAPKSASFQLKPNIPPPHTSKEESASLKHWVHPNMSLEFTGDEHPPSTNLGIIDEFQ